MTTAIATGHSQKVSAPAGRKPVERIGAMLTFDEVVDYIANRPGRTPGGQLPRRHYLHNLEKLVLSLRRNYKAQGTRFFRTWEQIGIARGADPQGSRDANVAHSRRSSKRYLRDLEAIGLLSYEGRAGKGGGVWIELHSVAHMEDVRRSIQLSYGGLVE